MYKPNYVYIKLLYIKITTSINDIYEADKQIIQM